jgi:hypothetical protein
MTPANMRALGVQRLLASCLNDPRRHTALIDVSASIARRRSSTACATTRLRCRARRTKRADAGIADMSDRIAAFALAQHLPSFSTVTAYAEFGGLLAYGPPRGKLLAKSGYYVKRILDGANPGELPVEQPTQIELWINLKTAKALGLEIPPQLLARADEVIE